VNQNPAQPPAARVARREESDALAERFGLPRRADAFIVVAEQQGDPLAAALVETKGHPLRPDAAFIASCAWDDTPSTPTRQSAWEAILHAARPEAERRGSDTLLVTLPALAHEDHRAVESARYTPTSDGPYRPLGGGLVEYLHGYTGPDDYQVDFEPTND